MAADYHQARHGRSGHRGLPARRRAHRMDTAVVDAKTGRKCYLDVPSDLVAGEDVTFVLNLHGGGSVGHWQREYFPACDYVDRYRLVVATPSAATKAPTRHWAADADDAYLVGLVE